MICDEARKARERLAHADAARSGIEEAEALSRKKNELRTLATKVRVLTERRRLLRQGAVPLSQPPNVESVRKSCVTMLTKFTESPKAATLVDKQRWTKLTGTLAEFTAEEETLQIQAWRDYIGTRLFGGVPPEQRERTILITLPDNQTALARYKLLYAQFLRYRAEVPRTTDELEGVREISNQLSEIRFVENQDVPSAVRQFFNATSSGSGANLELLTTEVLDWLRENGMLKNFAVRAR